MKSLSRKQALAAMLLLYWGVFLAAHYGLHGHGYWLGILFGCTVIATVFTTLSVLMEKRSGGRDTFDGDLVLMYGVRVAMTVVSSFLGIYFICLAGIRMFA